MKKKLFGKTVEALLKNSYGNKEIIVVDDGSTDGTLEVAQQYAENEFVKVVSKPNGGKWDALNIGINAAKGNSLSALMRIHFSIQMLFSI